MKTQRWMKLLLVCLACLGLATLIALMIESFKN